MPKYCTREYSLPEQAYAGLFWTVSSDEKLLIHNMFQVYSELDTLISDAHEYIEIIQQEDVLILNEGMLLPLKLKRSFQLKKKYWKNPSIEIDPFSKIVKNIEMLIFPAAYELLVTPAGEVGGTEIFSFTFPFLAVNSQRDIESFMLTSNHPVPTDAKNAGVYEIDEPIGINWDTKKLIKNYQIEASPSLKN